MNAVVITRFQSFLTENPSEYFKLDGTTVHPRRTPVNPAYLEKEFTSIATSFAPSISNIDFGTPIYKSHNLVIIVY